MMSIDIYLIIKLLIMRFYYVPLSLNTNAKLYDLAALNLKISHPENIGIRNDDNFDIS